MKRPARFVDERVNMQGKRSKKEKKSLKKNVEEEEYPWGQAKQPFCGVNRRVRRDHTDYVINHRSDEWEPSWIPASIYFSTGLPRHAPVDWDSSKMGKLAAKQDPKMDCIRLAGTITLEMTFNRSIREFERMLSRLECKISPRIWPQKETKKRLSHPKVWVNKYGDPENCSLRSRGLNITSLSKVNAEILKGFLVPTEDWMISTLASLRNYQNPEISPWKVPLLRVIIPLPEGPVDRIVTFEVRVYFSRLLFFMIADDTLCNIMKHLETTYIKTPIHETKQYPRSFMSNWSKEAANTSNYIFTLAGLLKAHEHSGYREAPQPRDVSLTLKTYQRQTLAWMQDHESLPNMGLNSLFWEERQWLDGGSYYYFPAAGELRLERPPTVRGGLLCEEMGLGKTLEMVSLIVTDLQKNSLGSYSKSPTPNFDSMECVTERDKTQEFESDTTLVIVPLTLLDQWIRELKKCTIVGRGEDGKEKHALRISHYPLDEGDIITRYSQTKSLKIAKLSTRADVLLVTYKTLAMQHSHKILQKIRWRRVVLDEMQEVRSSTTELARACANLKAQFRWMVSGTPFYTSIDDLNGELNFLGVQPFCLSDRIDGFWERRIKGPWIKAGRSRGERSGFYNGSCVKDDDDIVHGDPSRSKDLLDRLLNGVMIRHSKSQTTLDGKPIIYLPPFKYKSTPISLNPRAGPQAASQAYIYRYIEELGITAINKISGFENPVAKRTIELVIRLLREACISPYLINGGAGCRSQIMELYNMIRNRLRWDENLVNPHLENIDEAEVDVEVSQLTAMDGANALNALLTENHTVTNKERVQERAKEGRVDAFAYFDSQMVSHGNTVRNNYDTKRDRAMEALTDRLEKVENAVRTKEVHKLQATARSWVQVRPIKVYKKTRSKGSRRTDEKAVNRIVFDLQTVDDGKQGATEFHRDTGQIFYEIELFSLSVLRKGPNPGRRIGLERSLGMEEVREMWRLADLPSDVTRLIDQTNLEIKEWDRKKKDLQKMLPPAPKKKTSDEEKKIAQRRRDMQNRISDIAKRLKSLRQKLRTLNTDLNAYRSKILGNYLDEKGLVLIMRIRRPLKYAPLLRWQLAVEKITAGRAFLFQEMSLRHLRRLFKRLKLKSAISKAKKSGNKGLIAKAKEEYKRNCPIGWRREGILEGRTYSPDKHYITLKTDIDQIIKEAGKAKVALADLEPYMVLLKKIIAKKTADGSLMHSGPLGQSGFQLLNDLVEGKEQMCSICLDTVKDPTFTRCIHLFCARCILRCFKASKFLNRHSLERSAQCPVCRGPYTLDSLIRVKLHAPRGSVELPEVKRWEDQDEMEVEQTVAEIGFDYHPGFTTGELKSLPGPGCPLMSRIARFAAFSPLFITHLFNITGIPPGSKANVIPLGFASQPRNGKEEKKYDSHNEGRWWSPKMRALVEQIRLVSRKEKNSKIVVFSQLKQAILHAFCVLNSANIKCVRIVKGDRAEFLLSAVHTFNTNPNCTVLLLHAGPAASGLTLTVARHVILLEPFLKSGEEAQALNRCHRIGQTRPVECQVFYYQKSVEERMLWYRSKESSQRTDTDSLSLAPVGEKISNPRSRNRDALNDENLRREKLQVVIGALEKPEPE